MDAQLAQFVLFAITAVAVVVWLFGLQFLVGSARGQRPPPRERLDDFEPACPTQLAGHVEVEGAPEILLRKAAAALASGRVGGLGQLRIVERTADAVVFEEGAVSPAGQAGGLYLRRGSLRFAPSRGDRTRVDYAIEVPSGRALLALGAVFVVLGLTAIAAGFWAIWTYVVPNPNLAVRGQTLQMLQVAHFLWPPFLFGALYRRRYSVVRAAFDTFVHNLPYLQEG